MIAIARPALTTSTAHSAGPALTISKYSTLCKTCANIILTRKEHNVAVLQLKTFLSIQLHSNSPFLPICLPKSCGKTCRTWGGQTEEDISGRDAFSKKFQDGSIQNLFIINNTACKEKLNSWVSRKAKRFISIIFDFR